MKANIREENEKKRWTDNPNLILDKNELGSIVDVLDNEIAFANNTDLRPQKCNISYTKDMINEILKCRSDIIYFAENYFKTQTPNGFDYLELFDYQKEIIIDMVENQHYILMLPRQMGKTTLARIFILHSILFGKDINYGIAANKEGQAKEILDGIKMAYMYLPLWMQQGIIKWNAKSVYTENGGRIQISATSSSSFRGMSFAASYEFTDLDGNNKRISSGIYTDECAFIPKNKWTEFKNSVIPTVSSGAHGKIMYTSTPNGMNHFHGLWINAVNKTNGFFNRFVPYWKHPERNEEWALKKRKELGSEVAFNQEFGCKFSGSSYTLLNDSSITKLAHKEEIDIFNGTKIYEEPIDGHLYTIGVDTAKYGEGDFLSLQVIDITNKPFRQVGSLRQRDITYLSLVEPLHKLGLYYNNAHIFIENNSGDGQSTADILFQTHEYENLFSEKRGIFGFRTTVKSRKIGLQNLKQLIDDDMLIINDKETIEELLRFSLKNGKYQATDGYSDDSVMAVVAGIFFLQVKNWVDSDELSNLFGGSEDNEPFVFGFMNDSSGNMIAF